MHSSYDFWKTKKVKPSLKPPVDKELRVGVVYQIKGPRWHARYVGQTTRHLKTRISDHKNKGPVKEHFLKCEKLVTFDCIDILASSSQREHVLLTLEALHIKNVKPSINTKDEFRSRALRIRI